MNRALSSLRKKETFRNVYRKGRVYADGALTLYILQTDGEDIRFGASISKKSGNSVVRHRFVRIIREIMRESAPQMCYGADIVFVARKGRFFARAKEVSYRELRDTAMRLFRRARLTNEDII